MSFLTGDPLPGGTSTSQQTASNTSAQQSISGSSQQSSTEFAPWASQYLSGLASEGQKYLGKSPQELVAAQSGLQTAAYDAAPAALTGYQGAMQSGLTAGQAGVSGINEGDIARFYNPYEQGVVDYMGQQSAQNVQRNLLPQLKAAFAGAGAMGSQRYANATGQAMGDVQSQLLGQQAQLKNTGWNQALQAALSEKNQQIQGAGVLGQLGAAEQNAAISGLKTQAELGAQQQAYSQSLIDAPVVRAQNIGQILRGYPMQTSQSSGTSASESSGASSGQSQGTSVGTTPSGGYTPSGLQQVAQLGSLVGALGNPNNAIGKWIGGLFNSSSTPSPLPTNPDGSTYAGGAYYPDQ